MKAMLLERTGSLSKHPNPLVLVQMEIPKPGTGEILIKISCCGICHTELDEIEGRTSPPQLPVILGHQVVGVVQQLGKGCNERQAGERVGVAWIYSACGKCSYCQQGLENLCPEFKATGRDAHGGYAEYMIVPEKFCYLLPEELNDVEAAPLLCAGAIGYRSYRLCNIGDHSTLGLTGFGASGHLVLKMVKYLHPEMEVFVFARNPDERAFALELGAKWAGDTMEQPPDQLDAIIDTTPVWKPVLAAMKQLKPGGRLVINAIRKEGKDLKEWLSLDYPSQLWMEKEIKSVANITRTDVHQFLKLAASIPLKAEYQLYPLEKANEALHEMKNQKIRGAKVLTIA